jgi:hypothetical protein
LQGSSQNTQFSHLPHIFKITKGNFFKNSGKYYFSISNSCIVIEEEQKYRKCVGYPLLYSKKRGRGDI